MRPFGAHRDASAYTILADGELVAELVAEPQVRLGCKQTLRLGELGTGEPRQQVSGGSGIVTAGTGGGRGW